MASFGLSFSMVKLSVNLKFSMGIFFAITLTTRLKLPKAQQTPSWNSLIGAVPNKAEPT